MDLGVACPSALVDFRQGLDAKRVGDATELFEFANHVDCVSRAFGVNANVKKRCQTRGSGVDRCCDMWVLHLRRHIEQVYDRGVTVLDSKASYRGREGTARPLP